MSEHHVDPPAQGGAPVFIALSRFVVANDKTGAVREAFLKRPHLVDSVPGFLRMEVLSPHDNPDEIWLFTYWTGEQHYRTWHRSHQYHQSHQGIPKGLKLVKHSAQLRFFEQVAS